MYITVEYPSRGVRVMVRVMITIKVMVRVMVMVMVRVSVRVRVRVRVRAFWPIYSGFWAIHGHGKEQEGIGYGLEN